MIKFKKIDLIKKEEDSSSISDNDKGDQKNRKVEVKPFLLLKQDLLLKKKWYMYNNILKSTKGYLSIFNELNIPKSYLMEWSEI